MLLPVLLELLGDAPHQGISRVAVTKERGDAEQHLGDGEGRAPLVLQDVQADNSLGVDVAVVDPGLEGDLGWFEWVVLREVDVKEENSLLIWRAWRTQQSGDPLMEIVILGASTTIWRRVLCNLPQLLLQSLCGCLHGQGLSTFRTQLGVVVGLVSVGGVGFSQT